MPKLIYFDFGGRAECIRMLLHHAKVPFEDVRITFSEFDLMKAEGKFPAGQVPVYIDDNGITHNQTKAILFGLAALHGYSHANTFEDAYLCLWYSETMADTFAKPEVMAAFFKDAHPTAEEVQKIVGLISNGLSLIDSKIGQVGRSFMTSDKLTATDFSFFALFVGRFLNEHGKHPDLQEAIKTVISNFPHLNAWLDRMRAELADYLATRPASFI